MYPKIRYASQVLVLAFVLPAGAALAQPSIMAQAGASTQVAPTGREAADAGTLSAAAESNRPARAVKTGTLYDGERTSLDAAEGSQVDVVPAVSVWALLAVLASLVVMRVWRNGKRNLSAIR